MVNIKKNDNMIEKLSIPEKQELLRIKRSGAEKISRQFLAEGGIPQSGLGKGKEPKPWCECHNRNPCPLDKELGR